MPAAVPMSGDLLRELVRQHLHDAIDLAEANDTPLSTWRVQLLERLARCGDPHEGFTWWRCRCGVDRVGSFPIAANDTSSQTMQISGLASVPEDVIFTVDITHPNPSELRITALLFVGTELLMVLWIKDSLLLNVLMLVYPLDAVRQWQAG